MTHSHVRMKHDSFTRDMTHASVTWHVHTWHGPFIRDTTHLRAVRVVHIYVSFFNTFQISVLQCVVVCCSVWQCVAETHSYVTRVCCSVLQCLAGCCCVLQCLALCCSVLQRRIHMSRVLCVYDTTHLRAFLFAYLRLSRPISDGVCCSVLQRVAVCCRDSFRVSLFVYICFFWQISDGSGTNYTSYTSLYIVSYLHVSFDTSLLMKCPFP